jgi:hypothetical protein
MVRTRNYWVLVPAAIGVLVFGLFAVLAVATQLFEAESAREVKQLFAAGANAPGGVVRAEELERLPPPVRHWLNASGAVGRERARTVRLMQQGQMRTGRDAPWAQVEAKQYFAVQPPGFVWLVDTMLNGLPVSGRDHFLDGRGHMLITVASLVKVVNAKDEAIDQGAMLRYLGEIIWFPSAALQPYIHWEPIDSDSARATMTQGAVTASAVFRFDREGRPTGISAQRYFYRETGSTMESWEITCDAWKEVRGIVMPTHGDARWKLADGDLSYYGWEILDVEVNNPALYVPGELPNPDRAPPTGPVAAVPR